MPQEETMSLPRFNVRFLAFATVCLAVTGCSQADNKDGRANSGNEKAQGKSAHAEEKSGGQDHSGWWCAEHGVPEEICGQCSAKVAAECKKKGDWCKEHERPESQCFICHPEKKEQFAAQYRAKYGKEPPPIEDEPKNDEPKKEEAKKDQAKKA